MRWSLKVENFAFKWILYSIDVDMNLGFMVWLNRKVRQLHLLMCSWFLHENTILLNYSSLLINIYLETFRFRDSSIFLCEGGFPWGNSRNLRWRDDSKKTEERLINKAQYLPWVQCFQMACCNKPDTWYTHFCKLTYFFLLPD